ncbi:unnamed protein product, partial [marine sediment metagenome]
MPVTYIPPEQRKGILESPILQMAMQQRMQQQERQFRERELKLKEQEMPVKNLIQMGNLAKSLSDLGLDPRVILGTKA